MKLECQVLPEWSLIVFFLSYKYCFTKQFMHDIEGHLMLSIWDQAFLILLKIIFIFEYFLNLTFKK